MRPAILPEGLLGALPFEKLATLALRCHIYLRTLHGPEEFDRRIAPWIRMFETEIQASGGDDATALPVLVRRTEDMHDLANSEPGGELAWQLAAYSVRSGAQP